MGAGYQGCVGCALLFTVALCLTRDLMGGAWIPDKQSVFDGLHMSVEGFVLVHCTMSPGLVC